ncbi:hypothetical protein TWF696_008448 [Orbilia brochopaga]|uniref:Uncharacterized protein n=1 Tax=Orbilia brochopaga TaxID=3140254 RepID=A0AAV9UKF3_9PEZI
MAQQTATQPAPASPPRLVHSDPSVPPSDTEESPFLAAFLAAAPVAAEIISQLSTPQKQRLFATCRALATYRDSCYAWRSITLTKAGYEPRTSLSNINYQIQSRISSQGRYLTLPDEQTVREQAQRQGWYIQPPVESYFCKELDSARVWHMFSARPGFGSILSELVLDGTSVDMAFVKGVLAICGDSGKGLKRLSIRYCDRICLAEVAALLPNEGRDDASDSGFESQSDSEEEEEDTSLLRTLVEFRIYGIKDIHPSHQEHRAWLARVDRFFKYTADKKIRTDIGWCSQTLQGQKKRLRRPQCHGFRDLPFVRILPLADTGSVRKTHCVGCKKGPEEIGWHCDGCLKDVMCDICGDFLCDNCDPKRTRIVKCTDCPTRRCRPCFLRNGGSYCKNASCKKKATCGMHKLVVACDACPERTEISCSSCNPARKCKKCSEWIYPHCENSKANETFQCDCDFELCHSCCENAKTTFVEANLEDGSLEELVYAIDSSEYPIVPRRFKGVSKEFLRDNKNWCCFYCKIMPRRGERFAMLRRSLGNRLVCS